MRRMKLAVGIVLGALAMGGAAFGFVRAGSDSAAKPESGVATGETLQAFTPHHVTGANKNSDTCPVCMYPNNPAVQVWINRDDEKNIGAIVSTLEKATKQNAAKKFKSFVIFMNPDAETAKTIEPKLAKIGTEQKVKNVALAYLPNAKDEAVGEYKINTSSDVKNTIFVYKARKVAAKFVNFTADEKSLESLNAAIKDVTK